MEGECLYCRNSRKTKLNMSDTVVLMQYDANKKSAVVAYLLWFFLGMLGAHRFYLSQPGTGATGTKLGAGIAAGPMKEAE